MLTHETTDNVDTSDQLNFKVNTYKRMMPCMLEVVLETLALDPWPCTTNTFVTSSPMMFLMDEGVNSS
jgi:hypothetical protein